MRILTILIFGKRKAHFQVLAITHPSVISSSSFLVHLITGVGNPAAAHGKTALCPVTLISEEGCLRNTKSEGNSGSANIYYELVTMTKYQMKK